MKVIHVNTTNKAGGAARIMSLLCEHLSILGHQSCQAVGYDTSGDLHDRVLGWRDEGGVSRKELMKFLKGVPGAWRLNSFTWNLRRLVPLISRELGIEDFNFPATRNLLSITPRPDIIHLHNLHGNYFDLRVLPDLSSQTPVIMTMHDTWLLSGHCAYSMSCDRWLTGCGQCPFLGAYVPIKRDASAYNWRRKKNIYRRSALAIATPSRWLMAKVERSMLAPAVRMSEVIHNGVNVNVFCPGDRLAARNEIGLGAGEVVMLTVAQGGKNNPWKNFDAVIESAVVVAQQNPTRDAVLLLVGGEAGREQRGNLRVESIGYQRSLEALRTYYRAADVYIHMAKADTFPTTILESLACGLPVVASAVDGIPEQILEGITGFLVKPGAVADMAGAILALTSNPARRNDMSAAAVRDVCLRFKEDLMVQKYLAFYGRWMQQHKVMGKV